VVYDAENRSRAYLRDAEPGRLSTTERSSMSGSSYSTRVQKYDYRAGVRCYCRR